MTKPIRSQIYLYFSIFSLTIFPSLTTQSQTDHLQVDTWWRPFYERGMALVKAGQFEKAEAEFNTIIQRENKIPEAYYGLGLLYHRQNPGCTRAIETLKRAIQLNNDYAEAYYQLGLVCENAENLLYRSDTRGYLNMAVKKDPQFIEAWKKLADFVENITAWPDPKVIDILSEAVRFNP